MKKSEKDSKRFLYAGLSLALAAGAALAGAAPAAQGEAPPPSDGERVAKLVQEFEAMDHERLSVLPPIAVEPFELPDSSVHVMRAVVEETYSVDGLGEDTVELRGWIAVRHSNPRAVAGADELRWETAVLDTEFVGMRLSGESDLFGPVEVRLDTSRPSRGQVGQIEIPDLARVTLLAQLREGDGTVRARSAEEEQTGELRRREAEPTFRPLDGTRVLQAVPEGARRIRQIGPEELRAIDLETPRLPDGGEVMCAAPVAVEISMKALDLEMTTAGHAYWYSIVQTIPPVGETASVAVEPVRLIADGREVGTLLSGAVTFREVVRRLHLEEPDLPVPGDRYANAGGPASGRDATGGTGGSTLAANSAPQ